MKLAIAQLNCTLGDLAGNAAKILAYAERAHAAGASLLLTPELSLCAYPPEDLLLREGFYLACTDALNTLALRAPAGMALIVGHPLERDGLHYNAASVLRDGEIIATYLKHELPNHSVFDEARYFSPGSAACVFEHQGIRFGLNICADIWNPAAAEQAAAAGADLLLVLNASPFHLDKLYARYDAIQQRILETGLPMLYANLVGGQDELVFDGASFAMNASGQLTHQLASFTEALGLIELADTLPVPGEIEFMPCQMSSLYDALCLGVRDYVQKNRFSQVLLGLSGGIDSALTLAIAVDALGAERVHAVMMPSPYTAQISLDDAREMARQLGVRYDELDIAPAFAALQATLSPVLGGEAGGTTAENLQARIRGTLLMALSNQNGGLVLITSNKSEMAVGYSTLYGDMAGGFAVLKDLSKTWVYRLANYRNSLGEVIPARIIIRPPSAELRPDQTDQDSLPPYDVLDAILEGYVEQNLTIPQLLALGHDEAAVRQVVRLIQINEYKRRQAPVGIRLTARAFGKDWRYPITARYQADF